MINPDLSIEHIFISPGHNFVGHHGREPDKHPMEERDVIECVRGKGLVGDRFFAFKEDYKGQITFFAFEVYQALCDALNIFDRPPSVLRRNIITRGIDLNSLIDQTFSIQGIQFQGVSECSPCHWMNDAFGPGAEQFLRGNGGLRARILTSGKLRNSRDSLSSDIR